MYQKRYNGIIFNILNALCAAPCVYSTQRLQNNIVLTNRLKIILIDIHMHVIYTIYRVRGLGEKGTGTNRFNRS